MTTISPNRRRSGPTAPSVIGFFAVLILVVSVVFFRAGATNLFWKLFEPVFAFRNGAGVGDTATMRAQLASTTAALADRNQLYQENLQLKALLGRRSNEQRIVAAVLFGPPASPYDTLMLDAGKREGVVVGDLVFAGGTTAIGEITSVYDTTSRTTLFSAPGASYQAQISLSQKPGSVLPVDLRGQGAGSFSGEVPAQSVAVVGDTVSFAGVANAFVGTVSHIDESAGSSFETLYVQMPVNVFMLRFVEVRTQL